MAGQRRDVKPLLGGGESNEKTSATATRYRGACKKREKLMDENIPALSIRQPWCYAILNLGKSVENRTWATPYRGRIRLHAAKTWDVEGEHWLHEHGFPCPSYQHMVGRTLGAYLGEVTLVQCQLISPLNEADFSPWAFGPWLWFLQDPVAYPEPLPGRGYPGLYYPERCGRQRP